MLVINTDWGVSCFSIKSFCLTRDKGKGGLLGNVEILWNKQIQTLFTRTQVFLKNTFLSRPGYKIFPSAPAVKISFHMKRDVHVTVGTHWGQSAAVTVAPGATGTIPHPEWERVHPRTQSKAREAARSRQGRCKALAMSHLLLEPFQVDLEQVEAHRHTNKQRESDDSLNWFSWRANR